MNILILNSGNGEHFTFFLLVAEALNRLCASVKWREILCASNEIVVNHLVAERVPGEKFVKFCFSGAVDSISGTRFAFPVCTRFIIQCIQGPQFRLQDPQEGQETYKTHKRKTRKGGKTHKSSKKPTRLTTLKYHKEFVIFQCLIPC